MRMIRPVVIGFLSLVLGSGGAHGQPTDEVTQQIWCDVNPAYHLNPDQMIYGDIGLRWEIENRGWFRFVLRPGYRSKLGQHFHVSAGVGSFYTFNEIIENRWEIRPFQGVEVKWPRWRLPFHHHFRLEERFDFNTATWNSKNSLRGRYKLKIQYRWGVNRPGRYWQASAGAEVFFTMAGSQGQFQEQSRVTLGLDRSFKRDRRFRFEITWQQEQFFFNPSKNVSQIYLRFRLTKSYGKV